MTATSQPRPPTTTHGLPPQSAVPPTPMSTRAPAARSGWSPASLAYWFYAVAATGAVIGQTWVAVTRVPWAATVPGLVRVAAVLPFAVCLELLAMALSAMADERMRTGERAYAFRTFSAVVAAVVVGILVVGHWPHLYWSAGFGVLSASAYLLWLGHAGARRRDAMRAAGKLADTAPDYGLWRRVRHPVWTARAAQLARQGCHDPEHGEWRPLGLFESLHAAELALRADQRRPAIARAVEQVVRAGQRDARMAEVAVRTLDLDRLAAELAGRVDYHAWADRLAPAIMAPAPVIGDGRGEAGSDGASKPGSPSSDGDGDGAVAETASAVPDPYTDARARAAAADRTPRRRPRAPAGSATSGLAVPAAGNDRGPATPAVTVERGRPANEDRTGRRGGHAAAAAAATPAATVAAAPGGGPHAEEDNRSGDASAPTTRPVAHHHPHQPDLTAPDAPAQKPGDRDRDKVTAGTAAAVAYWYRREPSLHPADIAARIGRSERTVRRYWPPAL